MATLHITQLFPLVFIFILITFLPHSISSTCTSPKLTSSYSSCNELPSLGSSLHFTYNPTNKSLSVAFTATPPSSGWVAWGINPTSTGMAGTQALVAFRNSDGSMSVKTLNITSYSSLIEGKLAFPVYEKRAVFNSGDGSITIFASIGYSGNVGKVNHVWQVGPGVASGFPKVHEFKNENLQAKATLDLSSSGDSTASGISGSGSSFPIKKRNTHGILNAISWGLLFPIGAIIARYMKTFESADPAWFYVHVSCQVSGYAIGVAGWATGLQLGSQSVGIVYKNHRYIGIALFALATLQILALFLRPKKEHKFRFYWNIYHHGIGYAIIILGVINVFKGLEILDPEKKWKSIYVSLLIVLGGLTVLLEVFTWIVVLRRKSSRSTKPYA